VVAEGFDCGEEVLATETGGVDGFAHEVEVEGEGYF
jgi:hypothetical protein